MNNTKISIRFFDDREVRALGKSFPGTNANRFIECFTFRDESIDGKSKTT